MKWSFIKYFLVVMIAGLIFSPKQSSAQLRSYQFEQIDSLQKVEKRPVLIFIHTNWCKYCVMMKHTTFKDERVIQLLNQHYYFVDFNAEDKRSITFNGASFAYKPTGVNTGVHQLAIELGTLNGVLSYPTTCLLDADYQIVHQFNHYLKNADIINITNHYINK